MDIETDVYRVATSEEIETRNCDEYYSLLIGPNGFECLLTEPEDRNWHRDGKHVIAELNRLAIEARELKEPAAFGYQCYQDRCEGAMIEASVVKRLDKRLARVAEILEAAVCTQPPDEGVVVLSQDGRTHKETINGKTISVYDNDYFSPLGDALMVAWKIANGLESLNDERLFNGIVGN